MGRLLGSIFGLRKDERSLAFLMTLYHFLLLVSLFLLKPVRDSIFLSSRGAAELPFVFILTTVAVIPVAVLHTRAGRRMSIGPLIDGVSMVLVASLVGLRLLMGAGGEWVAYVLYAWVSIYGLLVTSQFWLLANTLFTASQSKRVFTLLSAGAILGAIVGGELTGLLVDVFAYTSENLLWGGAGVLLAATGLGVWIRETTEERGRRSSRSTPEPPEEGRPAGGALSILRESRHIQLIVAVLTIMVVVTTLVDYQFKTVAARAFSSEQELTTFLGQFYGRVSILALLVQFVLAPRLMRTVGIGGVLSVLPATLALGAVGMLLMPGLVAGAFLRGTGQTLRHSVDKTGRELLFVPVDLEKKKRVKVFIDLFVDQGAQGLGGLLLLGLAYGAGLSVQMISIGTLILIAVWGVLTYGVRESYVDQFRAKLRAQRPETDADPSVAEDRTVGFDLDTVLEALCSRVESDVRDALSELEEEDFEPVPVEAILGLLDHPSARVREHAIRVLRVREVEEVGKTVAESLRDLDPDVQLEAARYLYSQVSDNHLARLQTALTHEDPQIQAAAVGLIAEEGGLAEYRLVSERLLRRLVETEGERGRETRTHVARILGVLDRPYRTELLHGLLRDDVPSVVRAAIRAAGETGDRSFVDPLVHALDDTEYRDVALEALESFGRPILGTLYDHLTDDALSVGARRHLPIVFAAVPSRFALLLLVRSLPRVPAPVRQEVVRALSRIHRSGKVTLDPMLIEDALEEDLRHYTALGQILRLYSRPRTTAPMPLSESEVKQLREETLERLFRLLGLRYDQRDIYDAYLGITGSDSFLRDSAVEFIDNLVDYQVRRRLLPLLDDPNGERALQVGRQFFDVEIRDVPSALRYLKSVDDPRLSAVIDDSTENVAKPAHGSGRLEFDPWPSTTEEE